MDDSPFPELDELPPILVFHAFLEYGRECINMLAYSAEKENSQEWRDLLARRAHLQRRLECILEEAGRKPPTKEPIVPAMPRLTIEVHNGNSRISIDGMEMPPVYSLSIHTVGGRCEGLSASITNHIPDSAKEVIEDKLHLIAPFSSVSITRLT